MIKTCICKRFFAEKEKEEILLFTYIYLRLQIQVQVDTHKSYVSSFVVENLFYEKFIWLLINLTSMKSPSNT